MQSHQTNTSINETVKNSLQRDKVIESILLDLVQKTSETENFPILFVVIILIFLILFYFLNFLNHYIFIKSEKGGK
jgi:hypothetical protein